MGKAGIDTLEMTRRIRDAHAEQLKGIPVAERIAFYTRKAQNLHLKILQARPAPG
jgi:hypothetical protein